MTLKLLFQLIFGVFSFDSSNMRWFNVKRVFIVLFLSPIFITLLIINNSCLLFDNLFFPFFRKQKIKEPVFIVSMPRTATTYLYHMLANQKQSFTCFKLWEIVFAPSIIQKYICVFISKTDNLIGAPIKKIIYYIETKVFRNFKSIHLIGLKYPEEDEAVLLWSLSSAYFNFFYPDSNYFDEYFEFDQKLSVKRKKKIMSFYLKYVKRHNYVFNKDSSKRFLSKNPLFMPKLKSLKETFPDAKIISINRCPGETFPSTVRLNKNLYSFFTSIKTPERLNEKTHEFLIKWHLNANQCFTTIFLNQNLQVDFKLLIKLEEKQLAKIEKFLQIPLIISEFNQNKTKSREKHISNTNYKKYSKEKTNKILELIPFMKPYCY